MSIITPFYEGLDLESMDMRRPPIGDVCAKVFYADDAESIYSYRAAGGVVYPAAQVVDVEQFELSETPYEKKKKSENDADTKKMLSSSKYSAALTLRVSQILSFAAPFIHKSLFRFFCGSHASFNGTSRFFRLANKYASNERSPFCTCQALCVHPYLPLVAVAVQRSPFEQCTVKLYLFSVGVFLEHLELTNALQVGVTSLRWKPCSRNVLAVCVRGGVLLWSIHGLPSVNEAAGLQLTTSRQLAAGRASGTGVSSAAKMGVPSTCEPLLETVERNINTGMSGVPFSSNNVSQGENLLVMSQANSSRVLNVDSTGWTSCARAGDRNECVSVIADPINKSTIPDVAAAARAAGAAHENTLLSFLGDKNGGTVAHAIFFPHGTPHLFKPQVDTDSHVSPIVATAIAFSADGEMLAIGSREDTHVSVYRTSVRPCDALLVRLPGDASSGVSCLCFATDTPMLLRGYEDTAALQVVCTTDWSTRSYALPGPVLGIESCEVWGSCVFALRLAHHECIPVVHISQTTGTMSILTTITTGVIHGVGGEVLDLIVSAWNMYSRVSSGHILVMRMMGSKVGRRVEDRSLGVILVGAVPVNSGVDNAGVVSMSYFENYERGSLLCLSEAATGELKFYPSYYNKV